MNQQIRALFPATQNYAYLNSAAVSPVPTPSAEAVARQLRDVAQHGSLHYQDWIDTKGRARALVAKMLGVGAAQIAFMRNTSDGFAAIAGGLRWEQGENIVSFEREFPANFYPWRRVRDTFGVELRLCPERDGRIDINELTGLIDRRTRIVAISSVQYASGFKADLECIGRAARKIDALFVVDIIQGFGAMAYDLPAQLVDAASGSSHKWLCAPEGCGILYISERARQKIDPTPVGWISVETPWDFEDRGQPFKPNALAWESGTGASALFYGLEQSLRLLDETGASNIETYLEALSDAVCDGAAAKNYRVISSRIGGEKSQIVCIKHGGGMDSNQVSAKLEEQGVIVSARGDRIRIAPHFYNNTEDIDRLIAALP